MLEMREARRTCAEHIDFEWVDLFAAREMCRGARQTSGLRGIVFAGGLYIATVPQVRRGLVADPLRL